VGGLDGHDADPFALAGKVVAVVQQATGLLPSVGIAEGKFVARVAAALCPPGDAGVVPPGRERDFLRDKSVALLPAAPETIEHLHTLALHTLGDIAGLPKTAVEAQFGGGAGRRLWELARGIDREPLRPHRPEESLSERLTFDGPVVANEALVMAGRQLLRRLAGRLDRRAARTMHLQVLAGERLLWERLETFREPTADEGRLAFILTTRLSSLHLTEAADTLVITLSGIGREAARQPKLITEANPQIASLAEAIRQVRARYGRPMVWRAVEVDPCSRHPEERAVLIPYDA
ncbi:MAG: DNA polymerase Y family protein, partial [Candidatus Dormibacteraceae bacterium]